MGGKKMDRKVNYRMTLICILGIIFGSFINKVLSSHWGNKGSNIAMAVSGTIVFCGILILIFMKYYTIAIISIVMAIPLIVGGIGLYINNMNIVGCGIVLIFIIYPVLLKVIPKLKKHR